MSGEGAAGGSINYVTKRPHSGPIESDAYLSYGSFNTVRAGFGSGGSTSIQGLDYRIDVNRATSNGFIDDTRSQSWNVSTGLDYRVSGAFKLFGAFEYRQDKSNAYWGTPLVSGAAAGISRRVDRRGHQRRQHQRQQSRPVTIDNRTLSTNYNVIDNNNETNQIWLRGGFEWALNSNLCCAARFTDSPSIARFSTAKRIRSIPRAGWSTATVFSSGTTRTCLATRPSCSGTARSPVKKTAWLRRSRSATSIFTSGSLTSPTPRFRRIR
jgi:outer membrane receptor protein involved in Fe transport